MPLHPLLETIIDPELYQLIKHYSETGELDPLEDRLRTAAATDQWMRPYSGGERRTKYYKSVVQTIVPKIIEAIKDGVTTGNCPEIEITAEEIDVTRENLGLGRFGSPQDVLYSFTSERYPNWGDTLEAMGFKSACMVGEGKMLVTMAPRYLAPDNPDLEIYELEGAIPKDFWESTEIALAEFSPKQLLQDILNALNACDTYDLTLPHAHDIGEMVEFIQTSLAEGRLTRPLCLKADIVIPLLTIILDKPTAAARLKEYRKFLKGKKVKVSQEQIGLKYADEGRFIQKLLRGERLEHIQSSVKMIRNVLRGNKCEIDSIYRVVGEKKLVLVEAKDKPLISRAQLYQIYETFKLKLPTDWTPIVVAVLKSKPSQQQEAQGCSSVIDLVKIGYDNNCIGDITESLSAITAAVHFRWLIKRIV